jgi:uncharacterized protein YjdB
MVRRKKAFMPCVLAALLCAGCRVTVAANDGVAVTGVALDRSSAEIAGCASLQLSATVSPADASIKTVSWTSSDAAVASVSADGLVTSRAAGSATITVRTSDGDKTDACALSVTDVPVGGVTLPPSASIVGNRTVTLVAVVSPENAMRKSVTWTTSDPAVATVSPIGLVRGVNSGNAVITVHAADGGKTATCSVSITRVPVTGVALPDTAGATAGFTARLVAALSPADATDQGLVWSSANPAVATVSPAGLVTGVAIGSTTISVTTADGSFSDSCALTVAAPGTITITGN